MNCTYIEPWIGKCNTKCEDKYCEKHAKKICNICGSKATHGCDNTQFLVCNMPLCDNELCDTIHEVYSHGWDLKDYIELTGRKYTEEEIDYINKWIIEQEEKFEKLLKKYKIAEISFQKYL